MVRSLDNMPAYSYGVTMLKIFECTEPAPQPATGQYVGIDVGLKTFATLSAGVEIPNPRFFRSEEKALAKAQRRLRKAGKDTPERAERRKVVAHERIAACYDL